jgi:hypothetical protein
VVVERIRRNARRTLRLCAAVAVTCAGVAITTPHAGAATAPQVDATVTSASMHLAAPVVAVAATPTGRGHWRAGRDGGVLTAGDARFYGSATRIWHDAIVGLATTPDGRGYWLVDRGGAVFAFGNARFHGSMGGKPLNRPIVGMAATRDGRGYWLVASDGGVFAFGTARFRGSMGGKPLNRPIVGMAAHPRGSGYWLVASDGGIFSFDAPFKGSMGGKPLNQPVVGMAAAPGGDGYTLVAADGGLFQFGASRFFGSAANACTGAPAVGVAVSPGSVGYWIAFANAQTFAFSPTHAPPRCAPDASGKVGLMQADLFTRLNQERAARGLPAVKWDQHLANYATMWSAYMKTVGFRHSNIGSLLGVYNYVGENIAAGTAGTKAGALHGAWMRSSGHRANILAPGFTRVGIGVYCAPDGSLWLTQEFARLSTQGSPPPAGSVPPLNPIVRSDEGSLSC